MPHAKWGDTADDLIAAAREREIRVTETRLRRWQQEGLLPSPRRRGGGRGKGWKWYYPPRAREQLFALCDTLARDRSFAVARWRLWWKGYPIAIEAIRSILNGEIESQKAFRRRVDEFTDNPDQEAEDAAVARLEQKAKRRVRNADLRKLQVRAKGSFFALAMALSQLGTGVSEPDPHGLQVLTQSFGIPPHLLPVIRRLVRQYGHLIAPIELRAALDGMSDGDLLLARDDVRPKLETLDQTLAWIVNVRGGAPLDTTLVDLSEPPPFEGHVLVFLMWLSVGRLPGVKDAVESFFSYSQTLH